jgi:hypothetical protein
MQLKQEQVVLQVMQEQQMVHQGLHSAQEMEEQVPLTVHRALILLVLAVVVGLAILQAWVALDTTGAAEAWMA